MQVHKPERPSAVHDHDPENGVEGDAGDGTRDGGAIRRGRRRGGRRRRRRPPPQGADGTRDGTRGTLHAILGGMDGQDGRGAFRFVNLHVQEPEFTFLNADSHIRKAYGRPVSLPCHFGICIPLTPCVL